MAEKSIEQRLVDGMRHFFGHDPNEEQAELMEELAHFTCGDEDPACFVLKGYAGTGKTSMLGAYIKTMQALKRRTVLMAPTGRAAKVLAQRAGTMATTIHKRIYFTATDPNGSVKMQLAPNKSSNVVFIIDEASMIADYSMQNDGSVGRNLLEDIFEYVYSGKNCKLIFLDDEGQLPPVGSNESPALSSTYLDHNFSRIHVSVFGLSQVVRQAAHSGILENATRIRQAQRLGELPKIDLKHFEDVKLVQGDELIEKIDSAYQNFGTECTLTC